MARFKRMVAPIISVKHYVHRTNVTVTSGTIHNEELVDAIVAPGVANAFSVTQGSLVKAVHLDYWVLNIGASNTNTQWTAILEKVPAGQTAATAAQLANLGSYPNKKNVLHSFQGNIAAAVDGNGGIPFLQGWFKIPKGKQRMGLGDSLFISAVSTGTSIRICGLCTYKEYQ